MKKAFAVLVVGSVFLLAGPARTGDKDSRWKKFLPGEAYKELVDREVKILQESLKGTPEEKVLNRAKLAAAMIAALSLSADKEGKAAAVEQAALKLAKLLHEKGKIDQARKLAEAFSTLMVDPSAKLEVVNMSKVFGGNAEEMMNHLRTRSKGGDGIHEALQTNIRLKGGLNGIEEKIRSLAMKKMIDAAMNKSAAEMALLGYRTAVFAEVTHDFAPANKAGKKDPIFWREVSLEMRGAALEMAQASKKKDAAAVFDASNRLSSSCNKCHSVFK